MRLDKCNFKVFLGWFLVFFSGVTFRTSLFRISISKGLNKELTEMRKCRDSLV